MAERAAGTFNQILEEAEQDSNIVGFFLSGSRGKGRATEFSDYDAWIIVKDGAGEAYKQKYPFGKCPGIDLIVFTLSDFEAYAAMGTPEDFDRYSFAGVKVTIDKTGTIQTLIDEKGRIPQSDLRDYVEKSLDCYINFVYRSLKCLPGGDVLAARLEANISLICFCKLAFAIHDNRHAPYYNTFAGSWSGRPSLNSP